MTGRVHEYPGAALTVRYDARRCIHAAECARGLPAVFDPERKPWVDADGAAADEIAAVIHRCPTGALTYLRHDGGPAEAVPAENTVTVSADGPLYLRGDLEVALPDGTTVRATRAALCRCGASKNKPFCDDSHYDAGFHDPGALGANKLGAAPEGAPASGRLEIEPAAGGPLILAGPVRVAGAESGAYEGVKGALCRCGGSSNKPFCDGTHRTLGFTG
jgi:CDGSH-type Zn-finger protein/uncharacterized Fe-S cluster protein YjdI